jgi:hypothetical protein
MLEKCLLDKNMVPNKEFDWNRLGANGFRVNMSSRQRLLLGDNPKIIEGI